MDSPIFSQLFQTLKIDPSINRSIYLQLADGMLSLIKKGSLGAGQKLPSSRDMAKMISVNRLTIAKAFSELQTQGWLESFVGRGTFVSAHLPMLDPVKLKGLVRSFSQKKAGFEIDEKQFELNPFHVSTAELHLDDGFPDPRLAPLKELYRAYRNQLTRTGLYHKFGSYSHPAGSDIYKEAISFYLNETRALKTTPRNILSVRGTLMGINLVCNALIKAGDVIVSGVPGWQRVEHNFIHAKAKHIGIPVDEHGLVVDELRKVCKRIKVRMVYVTPHHHYPTTVALRIDRRLALLKLANEYGFIIFEDDYDFDFHYKHRPLLPLASADENGMVIYCGSFSKSFSPAFRMGYLAASENVIDHLTNIRILLDRQGDHILDNAMAELIKDGTISRFVRKAHTVYEDRRNYFCDLLKTELKGAVDFIVPEGGMSVWTKFSNSIDLENLAKRAYAKGLYLSNGKIHQYDGYRENAVRLGFASSSKEELAKSVAILKELL
ncbi:PLP-dependent aminotransferase family protein [Pedobacter sp. ASV28]|uniref:aminotransferase-like domain-containing protein n=1 Tax=Pedobacter sp. ASV28 TaxID=2795123 RepID=UPI0018EC2583|nr:PLP-dependent aminotransferase family protein [Pedobacter sp. ASV28]